MKNCYTKYPFSYLAQRGRDRVETPSLQGFVRFYIPIWLRRQKGKPYQKEEQNEEYKPCHRMNEYLIQDITETVRFEDSVKQLDILFK